MNTIEVNNIQHITEELKNKLFCKDNCNNMKYASYDIKNNYNIVLIAVKYNGNCLEHVSKELQNNYNIVFEAVKTGACLRYVSKELQNNYNIVFEAV